MRDSAPHPPPVRGRQGRLPYLVRKVQRHVHWARTEGLGRLIEEDRLDPRARVATAWSKHRWRGRHGVAPGQARPVYVVGLQRSGTNMIMRGVDLAPEVEVRNENDRRLFDRFHLRPDDVLVRLVRASRHQVVLVKPLCESHRVDLLLDLAGVPGGRAVWVYRDCEARARSEVSKFATSNLDALRVVAAGAGESIWQGQRLPRESVELVRSFDLKNMSAETAAVLFWLVRNRLYFDLGLAERPDVALVSYDAFIADPASEMRFLCDFAGLPFRPEMYKGVVPRSTNVIRRTVPVDPTVLQLARRLARRLEAQRHAERQASALTSLIGRTGEAATVDLGESKL